MAKGNETMAVLALYDGVICKKSDSSAEFKDAFSLLTLIGKSDYGSEVLGDVILLTLYEACSGKPSRVTELMAQTDSLDDFVIACRKENAVHDAKNPKAFTSLSYLLVSALKLRWDKMQKAYAGFQKLAQRITAK